jgi:hypothetical protein
LQDLYGLIDARIEQLEEQGDTSAAAAPEAEAAPEPEAESAPEAEAAPEAAAEAEIPTENPEQAEEEQ